MVLWLASYPRSGNTLLRQIIHSGWGAKTTSVYLDDLGDNQILRQSCGHYDLPHGPRGEIAVAAIPRDAIVKTHELPPPNPGSAIYVIRDGRAACVSLWHFYEKRESLAGIVMGLNHFGSWSRNVNMWVASGLVKAMIRYEDMIACDPMVIEILSGVLGRAPDGDAFLPINSRDLLASREGRWVRKQTDWRHDWSVELDQLFWRAPHNPMLTYFPDARALAL
jgi:hypothetical protein